MLCIERKLLPHGLCVSIRASATAIGEIMEFSSLYPLPRFERNAAGRLIVAPPTGSGYGEVQRFPERAAFGCGTNACVWGKRSIPPPDFVFRTACVAFAGRLMDRAFTLGSRAERRPGEVRSDMPRHRF